MNKDVYKMKLHDVLDELELDNLNLVITRVPGGWLYMTVIGSHVTSCFVPYSDEFDPDRRHTVRIGADGSVIQGE